MSKCTSWKIVNLSKKQECQRSISWLTRKLTAFVPGPPRPMELSIEILISSNRWTKSCLKSLNSTTSSWNKPSTTWTSKLKMISSLEEREDDFKINEMCSKLKSKKSWKLKDTKQKFIGFRKKFCTKKDNLTNLRGINFRETSLRIKSKS